ncbi:hypothetical protein Nepgr_023448 [Nepenthes gracilis]|uniref:Nitrate regulatory gene2 protein n=1 Tax=Nepenthes gracilis TaxID=150966 RepID=A0AAD3T4A9_NEPGR|nr:hypothetical protein Nepgr_023448 [Nepenthes gracilis]
MGCGGSKEENLPLVVLCKERRSLLKAAAEHRYGLAAAHVTYFRSLKDVGDALCRFVEEELVVVSSSSSPSSASPVLTLPSDEGKVCPRKKNQQKLRRKKSLLSSSWNENVDHYKEGRDEDDDELDNSHLHLSSSHDSEGMPSSSVHSEIGNSPELEKPSQPKPGITYSSLVMDYANSYGPYHQYKQYYSYSESNSFTTYYMKKSSTAIQSVIFEVPNQRPIYENVEYFGCTMNDVRHDEGGDNIRQQSQQRRPPTPPSPKVSAWDYFNPFETYDNNVYSGYYSESRYGFGSNTSSPDSKEVREREGIPDLEEETENELIKESYAEKMKVKNDVDMLHTNKNKTKNRSVQYDEGKGDNFAEETSEVVPLQNPAELQPVEVRELKISSPDSDSSVSNSTKELHVKQREVNFVIDGAYPCDIESSKVSSLSTLSAHGTRNLTEVARQIKDEFDAATDYGKEVSQLLEAGKLPYRSTCTLFRAIFARILYSVAPSMSCSHPPSTMLAPSSSTAAKIDRAYFADSVNGSDSCSLALTLEKLCVWEKKLYNEVKVYACLLCIPPPHSLSFSISTCHGMQGTLQTVFLYEITASFCMKLLVDAAKTVRMGEFMFSTAEERLRLIYEKKCKKLKILDGQGAETSKIEAIQNSIRKLLTRINVSIRAIDVISSRIHKLRDEELQPQVKELIYGLRRMWQAMLRCHQKQFRAILESRMRTLKANTGFCRDWSMRSTLELEMELLKWCRCFNEWVDTQRFYVESLNGWLLRCLIHEPEETSQGIIPLSPGSIGAPPVFVICHDWNQAMERFSELGVKTAMQSFATSLHQLSERQDEERLQRVKAEHALKDLEKQIQMVRVQREKMQQNRHNDALSERASLSMVPSGTGVSQLNDLKVDLRATRRRLREERAGHKEAMKLVHDAASRSIQDGLIPIFEALESFSSDALKAFEGVRMQGAGGAAACDP